MRVVLTDHVADDARATCTYGRLQCVAELVHREQHAAMHRLQAVADIGKRAAHDHAHGVIEIAVAHLVFEVDRDDFFGEFSHSRVRVSSGFRVSEGRSEFYQNGQPPRKPSEKLLRNQGVSGP